jgi:hypothetical protein
LNNGTIVKLLFAGRTVAKQIREKINGLSNTVLKINNAKIWMISKKFEKQTGVHSTQNQAFRPQRHHGLITLWLK